MATKLSLAELSPQPELKSTHSCQHEERKQDYQPNTRYEHSTIRVGNCLYMWGGDQINLLEENDSEHKKQLSSCVEVFNLPDGKWYWKHSTGNPPLGISGYRAVPIDNEIFYFGGYCGLDDCYHNSVHSLNVDTLQWRELSPTTTASGHPSMKYNCGMVHTLLDGEHYLAVIGGYSTSSDNTPHQHGAQYNGEYNNEVHYFNILSCQWITPEVRGDRPPPCAGFTLTSITSDSAVLFGGLIGLIPNRITSQLYIITFTKSSVEWELLEPAYVSTKWPPERDHSSALIDTIPTLSRPHLLVVGGACMNDCWLLDINKKRWKELKGFPEKVTGRWNNSLSVWSVSPATVWIIVFEGERRESLVNGTEVIELKYKASNDQWSIGTVSLD